ncbi:MAG: hypothetical protein ACK4MY_10030, partial [Brevundimonas sp.]
TWPSRPPTVCVNRSTAARPSTSTSKSLQEAGLACQTGDRRTMDIVENKSSSRRHPLGGGGFDSEKSHQKLRLGKPGGERRFRLIVSARRDKRAKMNSVHKRHDCAEDQTRVLDGRGCSEYGLG